LRDVSFELSNELFACGLICSYELAILLGIEPLGKLGGTDEIAE